MRNGRRCRTLTWASAWLVAPAIALMFVLGIYPQLLIGVINRTVDGDGGAIEVLSQCCAWTIYISFIGVARADALPKGNARAARADGVAHGVGRIGRRPGGVTAQSQPGAGGRSSTTRAALVDSFAGHQLSLAADGISVTLVLLTGLAAVAGILFSWNIEHRAKEFFAFYLALIGGVYGVFLSFDCSCCSSFTKSRSSRSISSSRSGVRHGANTAR